MEEKEEMTTADLLKEMFEENVKLILENEELKRKLKEAGSPASETASN